MNILLVDPFDDQLLPEDRGRGEEKKE